MRRMMCTESGMWENPVCTAVVCVMWLDGCVSVRNLCKHFQFNIKLFSSISCYQVLSQWDPQMDSNGQSVQSIQSEQSNNQNSQYIQYSQYSKHIQYSQYFQYSQYSQYNQYSLESKGNCTVDRGSCAVYALLLEYFKTNFEN